MGPLWNLRRNTKEKFKCSSLTHPHIHKEQRTAMHDVDGSALIGDRPLLGLVVEFPMQCTPAYCSLHVDRTSRLVFLFVLSNHRSSVLEPNLVSKNMTNNNFARGLGLNDDDDKMNQLYNAAQAEDHDFFGALNYDGKEIEGTGNEIAPRLNSIFDHPLITKIRIEENGRVVSAWKCGLHSRPSRSFEQHFKGLPNATKTLKHVTRMPSCKIRPCNGNIPPESVRQCQRLKLERESLKDEREMSKLVVSNSIEDSQHRVFESMRNSGGQRQQVLVFIFFMLLCLLIGWIDVISPTCFSRIDVFSSWFPRSRYRGGCSFGSETTVDSGNHCHIKHY